MPLLEQVVAGWRARANLRPMRFATFPAWAALLAYLAACGTDPRVPTTVVVNPTTLTFTAVGEEQQLSSSITDQDGAALPSETTSWSSSDPEVATVTGTGLVTARGPGSAEIIATAGSATASAHVSVVQTPVEIEKVSGDLQTGSPGSTLAAPLVVRVKDSKGNAIAGLTVTFSVSQGEGSVSTVSATTGADGKASTTFSTGTDSGSPQEVLVAVPSTTVSTSFSAILPADPTSFDIGIRYAGSPTTAQRQAFATARVRWESVISQDLEEVFLQAPADDCASGTPAVNQDVDDLLILVRLVEIDGPGNVLGGASPCYIRTSDDLSILGVMEFDTADLEMLEEEGFLSAVILHEMGHVLGFGTLWQLQGLLVDPVPDEDPPTPGPPHDPHFTGPQAISMFDDIGGTTYVEGEKVPVENTGGPGTHNGHWRESVFGPELMTGLFTGTTTPLSVVTLASLADQGYSVDFTKADPFTLSLAVSAFSTGRALRVTDDILSMPIRKVDRRGRVTGVVP
jgi:hypothetical protein